MNPGFTIMLLPIIILLAINGGRDEGIFQGIVYFIFYIILMMIAQTDYYTYKIPDALNLLLCIYGLIYMLISGNDGIIWRVCGSLIVPFLLLIIGMMYPGSIGGGDIKFLAAAGIFIGFEKTMYAAAMGSILAGVTALGLMMAAKASKKRRMAMAPYYAVGIVLSLISNWHFL